MVQAHNPTTKVVPKGADWHYSVICNGTGCDGAVIDKGTKPTQHEANTAAITASGIHKLG